MVLNAGSVSVGELLIRLRISAVAACCSRVSSRSRVRVSSCCRRSAVEERRRRGSALRRFTALRLRALVGVLLALERRRIAHPRLRTTPILTDYIRDLRPAKWGSMINLRSLSALGDAASPPRATVTAPWALRGWKSGVWPIGPQANVGAVIYELPDLDHFPRPAAVPVIAISLAFRRPPRASWKRQ